jgi:ribosome maturation factor RimP
LNREFYRDEDYERFVGSRIKITWRDPETAANRTDIGVLVAHLPADDKKSSIDVEIGDHRINIQLASVIKTRLEPEL